MKTLPLLFAAAVFTAGVLHSQVSTGSITGLVSDSTGAAVPQVPVRVINEGTGAERTVISDAVGNYVATNLAPGRYRVEASLAGFQSQAKTGLVLSLDQTLTVNFSLSPGEQKQSVQVVARAEQMVQAATSSLGEVIEEEQIRSLPLNGRNWQQLITLNTGVTSKPGGGVYHINGGRAEGNLFLIDGMDISSPSNDAIRVQPNVEALGEFKILSNNFTAEYGRSMGGVINAHIKNGTNQFHGTLFHFLRNRELDAKNFFAQTKPPYVFNQFGGSLGGPIVKNKLFFFGDFQGTRSRTGSPTISNVPTALQKSGDFSALLGRSVIYDPTTNPRVPFAGNIIPASRFDKPSARMFSLLPDPNQAGPFNFYAVTGLASSSNTADYRVDYVMDDRNRLAAHGTIIRARPVTITPILGPLNGNLITTRSSNNNFSAVMNYTRVLSPGAVNEFVFGYTRDVFFGPKTEGMQYEPNLGVKGLNTNQNDDVTTGFPLYLIPGYIVFGGPAGGPYQQVSNIPQLSNSTSWLKGRHTFKGGVLIRFRQFNLAQSIWPRGLLSFHQFMTSNNLVGGDPVASALLGYPLTGQRDIAQPWGQRAHEYGLYFQDDFKVSRRLTLNLGMRYDLFQQPYEQHDRLSNFDLASKTLLLAGQGGNSRRLVDSNKRDFSPHVGFAFLPTGDNKTVIRGGYAIGYFPLASVAVGTNTDRLTANAPFKPNFSTTFNFLAPTVRVSDGLDLPIQDPKNPTGLIYYIPPQQAAPYLQQFNFNIQRALPSDFLADVAYAGSRGVHLTGAVNINQAPPGATPPAARSPISPAINVIEALLNHESSIYHSLQAKLERRFSKGFYLLTAYTYSKAIDDGSYTIQSSSTSSAQPQDSRNWRAERAASDFDIRHRLALSAIYELPFGKGRHYLSKGPRAAEYVLGGWQLNGIALAQTGTPFTPTVGTPKTNAGGGGAVRPDRIGNGALPDSDRSISRWYDKTAFVPQGTAGTDPYHFGNSGRNILRGPSFRNLDFSLFKRFPIHEAIRLEFRAEMFNIFNHPNFGLPVAAVDLPTAGIITGATAPRQIQFALKLVF